MSGTATYLRHTDGVDKFKSFDGAHHIFLFDSTDNWTVASTRDPVLAYEYACAFPSLVPYVVENSSQQGDWSWGDYTMRKEITAGKRN